MTRTKEDLALVKPRADAQSIVASLRHEIVTGRWPPGQQLPVLTELQARYRTNHVTLLRAIHALVNDGYLRTEKRIGVFVHDHPPHLSQYALVFFNDPADNFATAPSSRYYTALANEAMALQQHDHCRILLFYGVDQHADSDDYQRLLSHLNSRRLAGIIFANHPYLVQGSPILEQPDIARVALTSEQHFPQVPAVAFSEQWLDRAFDYLAARGRKRIAIVMQGYYSKTGGNFDRQLATIDRLAVARGLTIPPHWRQILSQAFPPAIRHCVRLLMYGAGAERPDGLVIADDHYVEDAQAALVIAGVRVPQDVEVVTHCNFPWPPPAVLPVTRLGFDIRATLRTAMNLIDRQRRGETVPGLTQMPALFEHELHTPGAAVPPPAAPVAATTTTS